ncbi:MAG: T9SS type A sorting domain-containing protein, partial [Pedobacter sp.]
NNSTTPTFTQVGSICQGSSFSLPTTSNNGIIGTWSPALNNNATTTYTFTPSAGQCATTTTMTVNVNNNTTPSFTQVGSICQGSTFTLPTTSNNGITGIWSPALKNNATTTYTFTPNAEQCATTTTMTVNVNNNTTPTFTQVGSICQGSNFTLPTTSNDGVTGIWSPALNSNETTTYTFTPNGGQCATTTAMTVNVNVLNAGTTVQGSTITATATGASYQWINCATNQPISGATSTSFTPVTNGSYAVIVSQNGCSKTSDCVLITNLSRDTFEKNSWKIYPNPAITHLTVELADASEIKIFDIAGKIVITQSLKSGTNTIDVSALSGGVYIIQTAAGVHSKFVKR